MKKLMIAAAIVCAAAFAQAASVAWQFTETVKNATYPDATDLTKVNAYLFTETAWDTFLASDQKWENFTGYSDSHSIENAGNATAAKYQTGVTPTLKDGLSSGNYYIVLASEGQGFVASDIREATAYDPLDPTAMHKDATWTLTAMVAGKEYISNSSFTAFASDVPEPTSGLLLLLGVAGLALRRRRA